jgi:hypothetical protein
MASACAQGLGAASGTSTGSGRVGDATGGKTRMAEI